MTLTAILPALRRSIPDPLEPRHWPEHTVPTISDVVVGGVSLTRLVEITGTPALLTGDLPHPKPAHARAHGIGNDVTVLVFRITLRIDTEADKQVALTDCAFDRVTLAGTSAGSSDARRSRRTPPSSSSPVNPVPLPGRTRSSPSPGISTRATCSPFPAPAL